MFFKSNFITDISRYFL
jgi:hypothetical protein